LKSPWQGGETLIAGIGQGYILTTPLQLAVMTARIANGGKMVEPSLTPVSEEFHARYSARRKHYSYAIKKGENDPFDNTFTFNYLGDLDFDLIKEAAKLFIGKHNFQNFTSKEKDEDNFVREIFDIKVEDVCDNKIIIHFYGNGFMRYMIRFIVGVLIAIGEKRIPITLINENLDTSERKIVTYKAPSEGLILQEVIY
jgi:tRNA pseudouridine38-40 synthase